MRGGWKDTIRAACLVLAAFLWPWGTYQSLPLLFIPCMAAPVLVLAGFAVAAFAKEGRLRIPFELVWPPLIALGAMGVHAVLTRSLHGIFQAAGGVLTYMVIAQTLPSREEADRCLRWSLLSIAGVAVLSIIAQVRPLYGLVLYQVFPTAFDEHSGAVLAGPATLTGGFLTLLTGVAAASVQTFGHGRSIGRRIYSLVLLVVTAMSLANLIHHQARPLETWPPPGYAHFHPLQIAALLAVVWFASRITSKLLLVWWEESDRESLAYAAVPFLALLIAAVMPLAVEPGHAVFLALLLRFDGRRTANSWPRASQIYPAIPCMAMFPILAWNIMNVDPLNLSDPRNYETIGRRLMDTSESAPLLDKLRFIDSRSPSERRTWMWRARRSLQDGALDAAVAEFRHALDPPAGPAPLLPPPAPTEAAQFLTSLRDHYSRSPERERGLAYERALALAGQHDNALSLLRLRAHGIRPLASGSGVLAEAVAVLLWQAPLSARLREWEPGELAAVLESAGARVAHAPPGFPSDLLPAVLLAHRTRESFVVQVWTPGSSQGAEAELPPGAVADTTTCVWREPEAISGEEWTAEVRTDDGAVLARVRLVTPPQLDLAPREVLSKAGASFRPAVALILPEMPLQTQEDPLLVEKPEQQE